MSVNLFEWIKENTSLPIGKDAPRKLAIYFCCFVLILKLNDQYEFLNVNLDVPTFYVSIPASAALAYFAMTLVNVILELLIGKYERYKINATMKKLSPVEFKLIHSSYFLPGTKSASFHKDQSEIYRMEKQNIVFRHGDALHATNLLRHLNEDAWDYMHHSKDFKDRKKVK